MFFNTDILLEKHKLILNVLNQQNNKNAKFVGGCVRDFLQNGKISEDIDISTILEPDEVSNLLQQYKQDKKIEQKYFITILDKDKKYGTIVVIFEDLKTKTKQKYEITTTRADIACFGRQANVKFCKSFEVDSQRRDFTINALYLGLDDKILDFHGGIENLKKNKIVFIGNPDDRIKEDYLRIIRFFRFSTKFNNFNFDKEILEIIQRNKHGLLNLSRERIRSEIFKMLEYNSWIFGLKSLYDNNLINEIFKIEKYNINNNLNNIKNKNLKNNIIKLFIFFNYDANIMTVLQDTLCFTKEEKKFCNFIINIWNKTNNGSIFDINSKIIVYNNVEMSVKCIELFNNDLQKEILDFIAIIKPLPIKSLELIQLGFKGEQIGVKLKDLTQKWIEYNFKIKKEDLLNK